jgi:hypothetical protein
VRAIKHAPIKQNQLKVINPRRLEEKLSETVRQMCPGTLMEPSIWCSTYILRGRTQTRTWTNGYGKLIVMSIVGVWGQPWRSRRTFRVSRHFGPANWLWLVMRTWLEDHLREIKENAAEMWWRMCIEIDNSIDPFAFEILKFIKKKRFIRPQEKKIRN